MNERILLSSTDPVLWPTLEPGRVLRSLLRRPNADLWARRHPPFYHCLIVCLPFFGHRLLLRPWCRLRWRVAPHSSTSTTSASRHTWRSPPSSTWRPAYPPWVTPSVSLSPTGPSSPAPADTCLSECDLFISLFDYSVSKLWESGKE